MRKRKLLNFAFSALALIFFVIVPSRVLAETAVGGTTLLGSIPAEKRDKIIACFKTGTCTLDDIVTTGAGFANLLTEISAALFFATFVYGGAMYLMSFGKAEWVKKGTDAMKGGAIGMLIVLAAWTIVRYIASAISTPPPPS